MYLKISVYPRYMYIVHVLWQVYPALIYTGWTSLLIIVNTSTKIGKKKFYWRCLSKYMYTYRCPSPPQNNTEYCNMQRQSVSRI